MRFFLYLSYKGTAYNGWQTQPNVPSVQQTIERGLSTILKESISVVGAGRTDTGVHAAYYVAHFDTTNPRALAPEFCYHLNCILPRDIAISEIKLVADDAHARFDASLREYKYYITTQKNPFLIDTAFYYTIPLDVEKMNAAAQLLKEYTDFTSFAKMHSGNKTNICHIVDSHWITEGNLLIYTISADRFLRNMVRAIVGTTMDVGRGKISLDDFRTIVESRTHGASSSTAVAGGLFLNNVEYEKPKLPIK